MFKFDETYKVIDRTPPFTGNYLGLVFKRPQKDKKSYPLVQWIKMSSVEIIVGEELLENFINSASVIKANPKKEPQNNSDYGYPHNLNDHIPSGFVTNILRPHILNLLYFKYHRIYGLIQPVKGSKYDADENKNIDLSYTRFQAKKSLFYQYIALRRVYDISWLVINISIDVFIYFVTSEIQWALLSALFVESVRRLLKI